MGETTEDTEGTEGDERDDPQMSQMTQMDDDKKGTTSHEAAKDTKDREGKKKNQDDI